MQSENTCPITAQDSNPCALIRKPEDLPVNSIIVFRLCIDAFRDISLVTCNDKRLHNLSVHIIGYCMFYEENGLLKQRM